MAAFNSLFAPISKEQFFGDYFNKRPLHLTKAAEALTELLTMEQFYSYLKHCEIVRAVFPELKQASIAPNDAPDMFAAGATICATGIDKAFPPLALLVKELKRELEYYGEVSVNCYLSPSGRGFGCHLDPRIVTVVQLLGSKKFGFCNVPLEPNPIRVDHQDTWKERFAEHIAQYGAEYVTLAPGDILCLPSGCLHWAEGQETSLGLNVAFDYIGCGVADYVSAFVRDALLEVSTLREAPVLAAPNDTLRRIRESGELLKKIAERLLLSPEVVVSHIQRR